MTTASPSGKDGIKLGYSVGYWSAGPPAGALEAIKEADRLGFDSLWTAEAYGSDALTPLAWWGAQTERIRLGTGIVQLSARTPTATAMAAITLDHLSGGRVTLGAGFGWNVDELTDHGVPGNRRRTALREYLEAMSALWTQEEAAYDGEFVSFGPSWAWPKPVQAHIPVLLGAGPTEKTFRWIARHADGWLTTPADTDLDGHVALLKEIWSDEGRDGAPAICALGERPDPERLAHLDSLGVTETIFGLPDRSPDEVEAWIARLAGKLTLSPARAG